MNNNNKIPIKINVAKSGTLLIISGFICKLLGAFYRIPLSNILGAQGIGIYHILFPLYTFSIVFVGGGMTFALSILVSKALALKNEKSIPKYFASAFVLVLALGMVFLLLFIFLSDKFAILQNVEGAKFSYYLLGLAVVFSGLISCFRGLFQGYNHMLSTAISQLIEQVVKLSVGLGCSLLLLKYGLYWGVFGAFSGLLVSEVLVFLFYIVLFFVMVKKKRMSFLGVSVWKFKREGKELFKVAFPVLVSQLMMPLSYGIQSFLVIELLLMYGMDSVLAKSVYGVLSGMVNSLVSFPSIVAVSLAVAVVPSISFLLAKKQRNKANVLVKNIYKSLWIIALPCVVGFIMLSENILKFVFSKGLSAELLPVGSILLKIASVQILFMGFAQIAIVLLQVLSKTWHAVLTLFVFLVVNIFLTVVLTSNYGIYGLCSANLISYAVCLFFGLCFLRNKFETALSVKEVFLPLITAFFMGGIIYLFKIFFENKVSSFLFLIIVLFVCVIFYFGVLILFKLIKKEDFLINNKKA